MEGEGYSRIADPDLGPGWECRLLRSGRPFYVDKVTKHTTWDHPKKGPLPGGWEERVDRSGRRFFHNFTTKQTVWRDPRKEAAGSPAAHNSQLGAACNLNETEVLCPLCIDLLYEPVTQPCGHNVCRECLLQSLSYGLRTCSVCRHKLQSSRLVRVNLLLAMAIEMAFPTQYETRRRETEKLRAEVCRSSSDDEYYTSPVPSTSTTTSTAAATTPLVSTTAPRAGSGNNDNNERVHGAADVAVGGGDRESGRGEEASVPRVTSAHQARRGLPVIAAPSRPTTSTSSADINSPAAAATHTSTSTASNNRNSNSNNNNSSDGENGSSRHNNSESGRRVSGLTRSGGQGEARTEQPPELRDLLSESINADYATELVLMGLPLNDVVSALRATRNESVDAALEELGRNSGDMIRQMVATAGFSPLTPVDSRPFAEAASSPSRPLGASASAYASPSRESQTTVTSNSSGGGSGGGGGGVGAEFDAAVAAMLADELSSFSDDGELDFP